MRQILVVATAGAGGDLQPLVAAAIALKNRGHHIRLLGDATVGRAVAAFGIEVRTLPPELGLGPALFASVSFWFPASTTKGCGQSTNAKALRLAP